MPYKGRTQPGNAFTAFAASGELADALLEVREERGRGGSSREAEAARHPKESALARLPRPFCLCIIRSALVEKRYLDSA